MISFAATFAATPEEFDQRAYARGLARALGSVELADITIFVTAASVQVVTRITASDRDVAAEALDRLTAALERGDLSSTLGVAIQSFTLPTRTLELVAVPLPSPPSSSPAPLPSLPPPPLIPTPALVLTPPEPPSLSPRAGAEMVEQASEAEGLTPLTGGLTAALVVILLLGVFACTRRGRRGCAHTGRACRSGWCGARCSMEVDTPPSPVVPSSTKDKAPAPATSPNKKSSSAARPAAVPAASDASLRDDWLRLAADAATDDGTASGGRAALSRARRSTRCQSPSPLGMQLDWLAQTEEDYNLADTNSRVSGACLAASNSRASGSNVAEASRASCTSPSPLGMQLDWLAQTEEEYGMADTHSRASGSNVADTSRPSSASPTPLGMQLDWLAQLEEGYDRADNLAEGALSDSDPEGAAAEAPEVPQAPALPVTTAQAHKGRERRGRIARFSGENLSI